MAGGGGWAMVKPEKGSGDKGGRKRRGRERNGDEEKAEERRKEESEAHVRRVSICRHRQTRTEPTPRYNTGTERECSYSGTY